jgi:protein SCO1/2
MWGGHSCPPAGSVEKVEGTKMNQKKAAIFLVALLSLAACSKHENKPLTTDTQRFHLKGKVISIDNQSHMATIDSEEIPGFMSAMAMPYAVKPESTLAKLSPGDALTAEVVVQNGSYWLENVVVTGHSTPPKPAAALHIPQPGDAVPDFQLINQSGKHISLNQYRGKTLILSFIYTRCPFPDYCPRVINQFAAVDRELSKQPDLHTHLLNISFDPEHDTPRILRDYGYASAGTKQPALFNRWEFAVAPTAQLSKLAEFFGLTYKDDGGVITHSLSTAVIGPDGRIFKWYYGNDWQAADLLKDAADSQHAPS